MILEYVQYAHPNFNADLEMLNKPVEIPNAFENYVPIN
mgnify:FL=1|jgi:hypothetical protein